MNQHELISKITDNDFHLGGSRRMAQLYPDLVKVGDSTDWDFYCADTTINRKLLVSWGFRRVDLKNRNYCDDLLVDIYKHDELNVEALVRFDIDVYKRAFESITGEQFVKFIWKSSPHVTVYDKPKFRNNVCMFLNSLFKLAAYQGEEHANFLTF